MVYKCEQCDNTAKYKLSRRGQPKRFLCTEHFKKIEKEIEKGIKVEHTFYGFEDKEDKCTQARKGQAKAS